MGYTWAFEFHDNKYEGSNMGKNAVKDLTEGSPLKLIAMFSMPVFFGFLFQQFYNLIDTMIVGHYLGVNALAGVGATGSINFLIVGFCLGICTGFAIPIAQRFGAKDEREVRRFFANGSYTIAAFSIVITTIVVILCRWILKAMSTPDDIMEYSYDYIRVIFMGIPATFLYNYLSCVIRALGDSKTPLIFLVFSSLLNIGLDYLFIVTFGRGVGGAAEATILSQAIAGLLCVVMVKYRYSILHPEREDLKISGNHIAKLCAMGVPMGLQYSITALGSVILQISVNSLGAVSIASITAANKVSMFFSAPFDALGATIATFGGQNVGAKKLDRVRQGTRACVEIGSVYSICALIILYFCGKEIIGLFVDVPTDELLSRAHSFLLTLAAFYIPLALVNILRFLIQGVGFPTFAILAGVFEMVARMVAGVLIVPKWGFRGASFASPLAWILADAFLIPAYLYVLRRLEDRLCTASTKAKGQRDF